MEYDEDAVMIALEIWPRQSPWFPAWKEIADLIESVQTLIGRPILPPDNPDILLNDPDPTRARLIYLQLKSPLWAPYNEEIRGRVISWREWLAREIADNKSEVSPTWGTTAFYHKRLGELLEDWQRNPCAAMIKALAALERQER